jgi:hypothetical protein
VEVIPVLKGLGAMYCIGWGYGAFWRLFRGGDALTGIGRAFSPRVFFWGRLPGALPQAGIGRAFGPLLWRWRLWRWSLW